MVVQRIGDEYVGTATVEGVQKESHGSTFWEAIRNMIALQKLENMDNAEFDTFFQSLPPRVKVIIKGGLVKWQLVLPQYLQ